MRTMLDRFIREKELNTTHLARIAGYSRRHIFYLREGSVSPTLHCMVKVAEAVSQMTGRRVAVDEVFDLSTARKRAS